MPRFALLFHEMPDDSPRTSHWDLLLEHTGRLLTWALEREPAANTIIPAAALPEHRLEYLTHEGDVSGGRGRVTRRDSGEFHWRSDMAARDTRVEVELRGERLRGVAILISDAAGAWRCSFTPSSVPPVPAPLSSSPES